jgi:acyl-CoA thioesterase FadM
VVLFFRFILATILGGLRPRIGMLDESRTRFTVLPHDCDLNFHLNAGRFISFMDVARMELLARMRLIRRLLKRGWRPVMGGIVVRYRRSILPFERFDIRSRVVGWDEKWFYLEHVVERKGVFYASAYVRTVIRSKERSLPPRDILALIHAEDMQSPPLPEFVVTWREAEDRR